MTLEAAMEDLRYCIQKRIAPNVYSLKTVYDSIRKLAEESEHKDRKIKILESWVSPITDPRAKWNSVSANPPIAYQVEWMHETEDTVLLLYSKELGATCGWYVGAENGEHMFERCESEYPSDEILTDVTYWIPLPELPKGENQ